MPYVAHWKLFLDYLMTPRVLKVLCIFQLDSIFHMGQGCMRLNSSNRLLSTLNRLLNISAPPLKLSTHCVNPDLHMGTLPAISS